MNQPSEASPTPQPKSAAASRILRAVEKSRIHAETVRSETSPTAVSPESAGEAEKDKAIDRNSLAGRPGAAFESQPSVPQPEELLRALSETAASGRPESAHSVTPPAVAELDDLPELPVEKTANARNVREAKKTAGAPVSGGEVEFRLSSAERKPAGSRFPVWAGVFLLLLGGGGAAYKFGLVDSPKPAATAGQSPETNQVFVPMSGVGGWSPNWGGDAARNAGRSISMFRPSLQQMNYRIEFEGQIEKKGFGWIFRAKDPQNYYAYKIEVVKPGLEPLVALTRFTVTAGKESQKHYSLFEKPVRSDTIFRIRMDALQNEFKTWVNDQLIETWRDTQHASGGIGLFSDQGESAQVRKVQIYEMR